MSVLKFVDLSQSHSSIGTSTSLSNKTRLEDMIRYECVVIEVFSDHWCKIDLE